MGKEQWLVMLACTVLGLLYLFVMDQKGKKAFSPAKYLSVLLCFAAAGLSTWLGTLQSVIGAPMIGLFLGMLIVNLVPHFSQEFKEGTSFAGKKYLNLGIILVGGTLNFAAILSAAKALPLIVFNICLALAVATLIGRKLLKLSQNTCTLVGGGTAICGGSAIATLASIIRAKEEEIAYAMTAIFLFDILGALLYPFLAELLHLSGAQFGYLAGCAINDTSSVVASQATYLAQHPELGDYNLAVTVKLVRATMLLFVAIVFTIVSVRKQARQADSAGRAQGAVFQTVKKVFPWFILLFFLMALLNSLSVFDGISFAAPFFKHGNKFFVTAALFGVGFKVRFRDLFTKGVRPLLLGGCTWLCVALAALAFVSLFPTYIA